MLEDNSNALPDLLQQAHIAVAQTDVEGRFIRSNQHWRDLFGYTEAEVDRITVGDITHPESRSLTDDYIARLKNGEGHVLVEKRFVRKDGSTFWANTTVSALRDETGRFRGLLGIVVEFSTPRLSRRVVDSQNQALQLVISGAPLNEIFNRLIATVEAEGGGDAVSGILLYDPATRTLRHGAAPSLPDAYNRAIDGIAVVADVGTCINAAFQKRPVITTDIAHDPGWQAFKHLPLGLGLVAAWSMPIISASGQVLGTFGTYFRRCRRPSETEMEVVAMLARTAALAIERHRAEEQLRVAVAETARQKRLYETILTATPDLVYVFDLNHRFTYANSALLAMWGRTWDEAIGKNCLELGYEPWHAAMHDRELDEVVATRRSVRGQVAFNGTNGRGFYDYIFVPVVGASGEVEAIAGTTRDITEARRAAAAAQFLGDLAQTLAPIGDAAEIIRRTVEAVGRHFEAHRCYFIECLASDDRIEVSENWVRDRAPSLAGPMSLSAFGGPEWWQEFAKGDFTVEDTHHHPLIGPREIDNYDAVGVRSYAVQPIQRAGNWTVVLAVTDNRPRQWTADELRLLENVAARIWPLVERARSEAALRIARDEALAASRAKDNFLAALSHELRTPLNPVLLMASEAAANPALPDAVRADFETISRNISLEARLIDDLLDLTRIAHDKLLLDRKPLELHPLLRQVAATLQPELREKQLSLDIRFDAQEAVVFGDEVRLQQIFWNVLRNAVKFTPLRGTITIATHPASANSPRVVVEILDTGIGLTSAELARVFDPFTQGEHSQTAGGGYGGLGLGLAISRKIAELHSGTLTATSAGRGRGATFRVELPLLVPERDPGQPTPPPAVASTNGGTRQAAPEQPAPPIRRILLVEDHEPSRTALARLLTNRQFEVVQAASAADALAKAEMKSFDLVISDIGLPDVNGYDLMDTLRTRHGFRGIALSGYGMAADVERSRRAGFMAHLTKPVNIQAIDEALTGWLACPPGRSNEESPHSGSQR